MRVIISGSKSLTDYDVIRKKLSAFFEGVENVAVISDGEGVSLLAEKFCVEFNHDIIYLPIEWSEYGKSAAKIRNDYAYSRAECCLILWDEKSNDTGFLVGAVKKRNIPFKVIRC
jgi:hypothetical protein